MKGFKLSPEAARDIRQIWTYIAADNVRAARRVRLQILASCRRLAANPGLGHRREDLTDKPLLFWPVGAYLIIYASRNGVEVVRVLHSGRDIPAVL